MRQHEERAPLSESFHVSYLTPYLKGAFQEGASERERHRQKCLSEIQQTFSCLRGVDVGSFPLTLKIIFQGGLFKVVTEFFFKIKSKN